MLVDCSLFAYVFLVSVVCRVSVGRFLFVAFVYYLFYVIGSWLCVVCNVLFGCVLFVGFVACCCLPFLRLWFVVVRVLFGVWSFSECRFGVRCARFVVCWFIGCSGLVVV